MTLPSDSGAVSPEEVRDKIGCEPMAEFEVARGTDSEKLRCDPDSVLYGAARHPRIQTERACGPMVVFQYNKHRPCLPPWDRLIAFTLEDDGVAAQFAAPEHIETAITGDLKSVHVAAPAIRFLDQSDRQMGTDEFRVQ